MKGYKRLLAGILAFCLIIGCMPVCAEAALADGSDHITQQLHLSDSLKLHLQGYADYMYAGNAVATVTCAGRSYTYRYEDLTACEDELREIIVDLAAAQMTEDIALTIRVGEVVIIDEVYSIRDYAEAVLEGGYSAQTKQIVYELLNYGAWAQKYFGYNSDDLANCNYAVTETYGIPEESTGVGVTGRVSGIRCQGVSLRLNSQIAARFYFKADGDVAGYSFTVDGKSYTPVSKDGLYYIEVSGINPQEMDTKMHLEVTDGSDTLSLDYAATDFLIRSYHNTTNETYKGLLAAAYSYFMSAKKYADGSTLGTVEFTCQGGSSNTLALATTLPADTPIVDFKPDENSCSINQSGNLYQTAGNIAMQKQDDTVLLTFCFDGDFAAGQTYSLPANAIFGFTDGNQYKLTQDYLFVFDGADWSAVEPEGDAAEGIDLETLGNIRLLSGQGNTNRDAVISRVAYSELNIPTPTGGGSYLAALSHGSGDATFRIDLGSELAARTSLSFMAYSRTKSCFALTGTDTVTQTVFAGVWTKINITLTEDTRYLDLTWDNGNAGGTVYLDNILAVEPVETDNLLLGFESYEEITGARITVGNKLGRMEINKDIRYITQGEASLKIQPQGDYSKPGSRPYLKLDLVDSTVAFGDLTGYKSICFDVYNSGSEQLHIAAGLYTGEDYEAYMLTNKQVFTLEPESWTTCTFDLSYLEGCGFYELSSSRYMLIEFRNFKESKDDPIHTLYMDNLHAVPYGTDESPADLDIDYMSGVDFETEGQEYVFSSQGLPQRDADIERITYYSENTVAAPTGGGSYGMRLSHASNYWPTFRLHFGQELPGGTEITFMAYGKICNGSSQYNKSVFEFQSGGDATEEFECGQWTQLYITLPEATEYIDLFWNIDRAGITSSNAYGQVYIDNIIIVQSDPYGDILEGYGFEERGNAERFTGWGNNENDATIRRFSYNYLGLEAPEGSGEYALKITHSSSMTPTFRINFGQTLASGTTITFDAYALLVSGYVYPKKNVIQYDDGTDATSQFNFKTWTECTVTLDEDAEYIDLIWSFKGNFGSAVCELYVDNIKATEPEITPAGEFTEGIGFEEKGNAELFTGQGSANDATIQRVEYADLSIDALSDGGDYALKLSHDSFYWPTFRISFGEELPADTQITFWAYGVITQGQSLYDQSIFEYSSGGEATAQFANGSWTQLTITLAEATEYIDLFWNIDRASITSSTASAEVYLDNFLAVEPAASTDITSGLDFETEGQEEKFTGVGDSYAWRDATLERVAYADEVISAFTDGGGYALKITCASSQWPTFRLNFGTTLAAGTQLTFQAYTNDTSGIRNTVSVFEYVAGGDATAQFYHGSWNTLTITLAEDAEYIDLMCNMDRWNEPGPANIAVYIDNITVTQP